MATRGRKRKVEEEIVQEEVKAVEEVVEVPKKVVPKKRVEIDRNEMIPCRNITHGMLVYVSRKTGLTTEWQRYGDEEYIDFGELLTMKSSQPKFLTEPWLVIDDEDVVEYLGLTKVYENMIPVEDLGKFFRKSVGEIRDFLKNAPKGTRTLIAEKAREMVQNEQLYDNRVIKVLEQELKIDLSMVIG